MAKPKQSKLLRALFSLIKDKFSLLRRATSPVHVTVLLATLHSPPSPPPSHRLAPLLSLSGPRTTASATVSALLRRLRRTSSAHVALKCLITVHHVIARGSFILRDQLCCRNFLNLSGFRDSADNETWELSNWVRFYASFLETHLITSRKIGFFVSGTHSSNRIGIYEIGCSNLSNWELMREIEALVGLIEEICRAPDSAFDHKSSLIHEILRLISEDYGLIQRLVESRLSEFRERGSELDRTELDELASLLRRVEECRERMSEVFGNKKRNETFWEYVRGTVVELTRIGGRVAEPGRVLRLSYGSQWVGVDQVHVTVAPALA